MQFTQKLSFASLLLLGSLNYVVAQLPTQVIVACAGNLDSANHVTVGRWDLTNDNYAVFDSFPGSGVQSVSISGNDAFVCADSFLIRYDVDQYTKEATAKVFGCQSVAVWNDKVFVTKGLRTYPGASYAEVRWIYNLGMDYTLPEFLDNTYNVQIVGDTAYVSNPGRFTNPIGRMGVVDMRNDQFVRSMSMDTMGKLVRPLYRAGDHIYSVNIVKFNNPQWGFISDYHIPTATFTHHRLSMVLSNAAGVDNGLLFLTLGTNLGTFDLTTGTISNANLIPGKFVAMTLDTVNNYIYGTRTDDATFGRIYRYDYNGVLLDSVNTEPGCRALAVDYNVTVGTESPDPRAWNLKAFPNPCHDHLEIDLRGLPASGARVELRDLQGRALLGYESNGRDFMRLEMRSLAAGTYILTATSKQGIHSQRIIKATD